MGENGFQHGVDTVEALEEKSKKVCKIYKNMKPEESFIDIEHKLSSYWP